VFLPVRLVVARHSRPTGRNELKSREEIMAILEAFDLNRGRRPARPAAFNALVPPLWQSACQRLTD
jgi:hypothetical protein